jgi:hypothetical protein
VLDSHGAVAGDTVPDLQPWTGATSQILGTLVDVRSW